LISLPLFKGRKLNLIFQRGLLGRGKGLFQIKTTKEVGVFSEVEAIEMAMAS